MKTENVAESHQTDIPYTFPAGHETNRMVAAQPEAFSRHSYLSNPPTVALLLVGLPLVPGHVDIGTRLGTYYFPRSHIHR